MPICLLALIAGSCFRAETRLARLSCWLILSRLMAARLWLPAYGMSYRKRGFSLSLSRFSLPSLDRFVLHRPRDRDYLGMERFDSLLPGPEGLDLHWHPFVLAGHWLAHWDRIGRWLHPLVLWRWQRRLDRWIETLQPMRNPRRLAKRLRLWAPAIQRG